MAETPKTSGSGSGSGTGRTRYMVEITTLFVPGASSIRDYCTDDTDCTGCGIEPEPPDSGVSGSGGASGSGQADCGFGYFFNEPGESGSGECDEPEPTDPNCPPAWWLRQEGNRLIGLGGISPTWRQIGEAMVCAAALTEQLGRCLTIDDINTAPPTGPCGTVGGLQLASYWGHIQAMWRLYGASHPAANELNCQGIDDPNGDGFAEQVQWTRGRFPAGTRIVRKRCVIVEESELCALCP